MTQAEGAAHPVETSGTRRAIVLALVRAGPLSPEAIAREIGLSRTAVLHQLRVLHGAGLVERESVRHGVGRPRHLYAVSPAAAGLLEGDYSGLARRLLEAVAVIGGEDLLCRVFLAARSAEAAQLRGRLTTMGVGEAPLADRVRALARLRDEQGFVCEVEGSAGDGIRLVQHNCPFIHAVSGLTVACDSELWLMREVLSASVDREEDIAGGHRCCVFRVEATAPLEPAAP
jgi:predicted ArsR family transcriptional regulator